MRHNYREYKEKPGHLARRFQQMAVAAFQAEMDKLHVDITPMQYAALAAVAAMPGIDQASLATDISLDRATITGVLDRLEAKSLLMRSVSKRDRRSRELALTPQGEKMLTQIQPAVEQAQVQLTAALSTEETDALLTLLRKIVDRAAD